MSDEAASLEIVLAHLDGYARVKLRGTLEYATIEQQHEALQAVTDLRRNVVIDMSEVEFIDSAGLTMLLGIARDHDGPVAIEGSRPAHRNLFKITGLDGIFDLRE